MKQKSEASFQTVLESRNIKKGDIYPIKLRVTHKRIQRYYAINIDVTKAEFEKIFSPRPKEPYQTYKLKILAYEQKASEIIERLNPFTFDAFKNEFIGQSSSPKDVYASIEKYIAKLKSENRLGTADSYKCMLVSLKKFKPLLSFNDITPIFLEKYEAYMLKNGKSSTTVGMYLRALRTIINQAINSQILTLDQYPFGKSKYIIPNGKNVKKALTIAEIKKFIEYETIDGTMEDKAKSFWLFSYLLNGINIKDICLLKYKDVKNGKLTFIRSKTQRTKNSKSKEIVAIIPDEAIEIISKYGNKNKHSENYIFDVINDSMSPEVQFGKIKQFIKNLNTYNKRIAETLNIETPMTTYVARHSFSTVLKRSGAPIEFISESLGHSSLATTESYLDSFEDDSRKKFTKALLDFGDLK